jgi:uncharacterized protein (DUF302 family)
MSAGLVVVPSAHSFAGTRRILIDSLGRHGVQISAQIDHAANARDAGLHQRPTTVVVFGSARTGTPLMAVEQTLGLDLPLRARVDADAAGKTAIAHQETGWIAARHGLDPDVFPTIAAVTKVLGEVIAEATGGGPKP